MCNQPTFSLNGGGADFANRQKSLFDKLEQAEKGIRNTQDVPMETNQTCNEELLMDFDCSRQLKRKRRSETKHLRGQESIFKRPDIPFPRQGGHMPDHKKNPQKWTKYSLGDVSQDDMSERTNTSTALSFLDELRKRKISSDIESCHSNDGNKNSSKTNIVFKKPATSSRVVIEVDDRLADRLEITKPVFRGSRRVMPEYVVGQGLKKPNKKGVAKDSIPKNKTKELKLDHLVEEDDE